mgnify:CR=1 FL=1
MIAKRQFTSCSIPRLIGVLGISLIIAVIISLAHLFLFPSMLNQRAILHPVLLRNGFIPYQHIPDQKAPLLPLFLSWTLPCFNHDAVANARTIHFLLICTMIMMCMIWGYRWGGLWALGATGIFLLTWSNAFGLWATVYYDMVLGVLYFLVFVLLARQISKPTVGRTGAIGLITGLAILTKQHAVVLLVPTTALLAWLLATGRLVPRQFMLLSLVYLVSLSFPIALFAWGYYRLAGSFQDLVYWTISFNLGPYPTEGAASATPAQIIGILPAFLMLVPFVNSIIFPVEGMQPARSVRFLLLLFLLLGALLVYPRYSSRHWAAAFPFIATLSGIACADLMAGWPQHKAAHNQQSMVAAVILLWVAIIGLVYIPALKDPKPPRWAEYSELIELADTLRDRIPAQGRVVLLPTDEGNSNLHYILGQFPPHYWLMNYPWWMNQVTITRWLVTMEKEKPYTLLLFPGGTTLMSNYPEIGQYINDKYRLADTVEWGDGRVQIMFRLEPDLQPPL